MALLVVVCAILCAGTVVHAVPRDCVPLEDHMLDQFDPRSVFQPNTEIAQKQAPNRVSSGIRPNRPLPTQAFFTTQIKTTRAEPMVLWPYFATMDSEGIVYDAFEFRRFMDPERTILADQQSVYEDGRPWHRLLDLGTNMFQKVSGPDGNPLAGFNGESGVKVGIEGSGEPELKDFGDLYGHFLYTGSSGTMEVPLVRGSILLTHIFDNADPVITPYCLDNINGDHQQFVCPQTPASSDGGSGYLSAVCTGSTLTITLHNTRPIKDVTLIQWAANTASQYGSSHGMHSCDDSHCRLLDNGQRVEITVPNSHGTMSFAINYIGHYLLPPDWVNQPQQVTCNAKKREPTAEERGIPDIALHASCDASNMVEIRIDLADLNSIIPTDQVQYALTAYNSWANPPAMRNCGSECIRQGNIVTIRRQMHSAHLRMAVNIIGYVVMPYYYWIEKPFELYCGSGHAVDYGGSGTPGSGIHVDPHATTTTQAPVTQHKTTSTQPPVTQHTTTSTHAPVTKAPTTQQHVTSSHTTSGTSNTGSGRPISPNRKFILELNEQGKALPHQTRKYVMYFSEEVTPHIRLSDNKISFSPRSGGKFTGIMQLAYLGAGPRGGHENDTVFDDHAGVFPYKPTTTFCVSESMDKAYLTFKWNPNNQDADSMVSSLLMLAMPHHVYSMNKMYAPYLQDTIFGFKAVKGSELNIEMKLPRASMAPDSAAVASLTQQQRQEIIDAIDRDAKGNNLDAICSHVDSYGVGKTIGFVARLASISREFNTQHYSALDESIRNCLEKWLRVQDTLDDMWKFQYDTVWGGLFLKASRGEVQFGADFGFPFYNDHHFHLGYFIYAAGYYVKQYPQWGQQNRHRLYLWVRDVANPTHTDPYFPVVRHMDMYTGFSWASGLVPGTRQEESASESLNCYHGVAALGEAFNDKRLQHVGQTMLAMELTSVREYWQVRSHNRDHFPPIIQETGVCGQIAEDSFYVYTLNWPCDPNIFPMRHACLVGIQVIPITAVSKYWVDQEWAASIKHSCESAIHFNRESDYSIADKHERDRTLSTGWAAFCLAAMAPLDSNHKTEAAKFMQDKSPRDLVGGTGAASTLLFIYAST